MRVLKFRIWDKLMGKMYQHNDIVFIDFKHCNVRFEWDINVGEDGQNTGNYYASFPERLELQEFTGLHDKNGNEIYEGDILDAYHSSFEKTQRGFVFFDNGTFMLCSVNKEGVKRAVRYWNDGSHDWYSMENYDSFELEIIGNRFENPELL